MRVVGSIFFAVTAAVGCLASAAAYAANPTPTAPGTWVSDDAPPSPPAPPRHTNRPLAIGQRMVYASDTTPADNAPPEPIANGPVANNGQSAEQVSDVGGDDGGDGDGDYGDDFDGFGGFTTDLWADVHAHHRVYGSVEYLQMWAKGNPLPPLVTTSPNGTSQDVAGVLGQPNTSILFGNQKVDTDGRSGGRATAGFWLVDGEFLGIEGHYMGLTPTTTDYTAAGAFSNGGTGPILARPFFNTALNIPASALVAFPGFQLNDPNQSIVDLDGSVKVHTSSDIQSAGLLLRNMLWIDFTGNYRIDTLAGYRFFRLKENLQIDDQFTASGEEFTPTTFASTDKFFANNAFHGGEFGLSGQFYHGPFSLEAVTKVALGNNHQITTISGYNTITTLGTTVSNNGGLLTQASNIGQTTRNMFTAIPEIDLNLRMDVTCHLRATIGYNFLWVSNVIRSGSQVDLNLDPRQINNPSFVATQPARTGAQSTFYMQGITGGLEYRY